MAFKQKIPKSEGINDTLTLLVEHADCATPRIWHVSNNHNWNRYYCDDCLTSSRREAGTSVNLSPALTISRIVKGFDAAKSIVEGMDLHTAQRRIVSVAPEGGKRVCESCREKKRRVMQRRAKKIRQTMRGL